MIRILSIIILMFFGLSLSSGQEDPDDSLKIKEFEVLRQMVKDGDTILHSTIKEITIYPMPQFTSRRDLRRYERLIYNLKIVYPYAIMAARKLDEMNQTFMTLKTDKERKGYIKQVESELMAEFEDELKSLTITQGRLLIKLIDRETGNTSYELLRELRGSFSAFFWQAIARLFGSNLKTKFDAEGEDMLIDQLLFLLETGQI